MDFETLWGQRRSVPFKEFVVKFKGFIKPFKGFAVEFKGFVKPFKEFVATGKG
jgi:hypothetical protein